MNIVRTKHYVNFLTPGILFSESTERPIEEWNIKQAIYLAKKFDMLPYAFQFSTWLETDPIIIEEEKFVTKPKKKKESGLYYLTGLVRSAKSILAGTDEKENILRSNVKCNNFKAIIQNSNSWLSTTPFYKDDVVIDWDGNILDRGSNYYNECISGL